MDSKRENDNNDYICKVVGILWITSGVVFFIGVIGKSDIAGYGFLSAIFFKVLFIILSTSDKCG